MKILRRHFGNDSVKAAAAAELVHCGRGGTGVEGGMGRAYCEIQGGRIGGKWGRLPKKWGNWKLG